MEESVLHGIWHRDVLTYDTIKPVAFLERGGGNWGISSSRVLTLTNSRHT